MSAMADNSIFGSAARSLAGKSFAIAHDAGRNVHENILEGSHYGARDVDSNQKEGSVRNLFNNATSSSLKLFSQSVSQYIEEKSVRRGTAFTENEKRRDQGTTQRDETPSRNSSSHSRRRVNIVKALGS